MPKRRFAVYFSWSRPREIGADLQVLDNRFPTLFEFRRAVWPVYEWASDPTNFNQGIAGFLDHVVLFDFEQFEKVISDATDHPVSVIQREGAKPPVVEWDDDLLASIDTLVVVSLDHDQTHVRMTTGEREALQAWLRQERKCLIICPHHDIGVSDDLATRKIEMDHHGDRLVPSQQRLGGFAHSLFQQLDLPIRHRFGLNPAVGPDGAPATLVVTPDFDQNRVLEGVSTFNLHPHLPHLEVLPANETQVKILARQRINPAAATHPYVAAGNDLFNAFLWLPPSRDRAADIYVCDATLWSTAFGAADSLNRLWRNLAALA